MVGHIFDIKKFALHDGPGIRTTVFLKGCPLSCWWCHNPESIRQIPKNGSDLCEDPSSSITKKYTVEEVYEIIEKDLVFYEESGGGVTFSGGEPLIQIRFLEEILKLCKKLVLICWESKILVHLEVHSVNLNHLTEILSQLACKVLIVL